MMLHNPLPHREFLTIWQAAELVRTDSGDLQQETAAFGISCFTIHKNTKRPFMIEEVAKVLAGTTKEKIITACANFCADGTPGVYFRVLGQQGCGEDH